MTSKAFWTEYFEDAYRDAAKKRREVLDRGLLLIAHLIREELPTATAISVNANVLTTVHDGDKVIWRFNDDTFHTLSRQAVNDIRHTLLDMTTFSRTVHPLLAADWKPVNDLLGTLRVDLPEDPDKDQEQDAAPAADDWPHGTPGENAGNRAQCGRLLIWDGTGKRVNDGWGEYLCAGPRQAGNRTATHVLAAPDTAEAQPAAQS
ncbi:hypothetical protein [Streptomyces canus]|uniref:hypothetical protein n=1 Tax=Streptomyces canus TaxID=58343 RepID=UPI0027830841|nr:hypothetical protein [Streptomyces canus]MDQ0762014.1 hypothetical protein [Streptomyces canus]